MECMATNWFGTKINVKCQMLKHFIWQLPVTGGAEDSIWCVFNLETTYSGSAKELPQSRCIEDYYTVKNETLISLQTYNPLNAEITKMNFISLLATN